MRLIERLSLVVKSKKKEIPISNGRTIATKEVKKPA